MQPFLFTSRDFRDERRPSLSSSVSSSALSTQRIGFDAPKILQHKLPVGPAATSSWVNTQKSFRNSHNFRVFLQRNDLPVIVPGCGSLPHSAGTTVPHAPGPQSASSSRTTCGGSQEGGPSKTSNDSSALLPQQQRQRGEEVVPAGAPHGRAAPLLLVPASDSGPPRVVPGGAEPRPPAEANIPASLQEPAAPVLVYPVVRKRGRFSPPRRDPPVSFDFSGRGAQPALVAASTRRAATTEVLEATTHGVEEDYTTSDPDVGPTRFFSRGGPPIPVAGLIQLGLERNISS